MLNLPLRQPQLKFKKNLDTLGQEGKLSIDVFDMYRYEEGSRDPSTYGWDDLQVSVGYLESVTGHGVFGFKCQAGVAAVGAALVPITVEFEIEISASIKDKFKALISPKKPTTKVDITPQMHLEGMFKFLVEGGAKGSVGFGAGVNITLQDITGTMTANGNPQ